MERGEHVKSLNKGVGEKQMTFEVTILTADDKKDEKG